MGPLTQHSAYKIMSVAFPKNPALEQYPRSDVRQLFHTARENGSFALTGVCGHFSNSHMRVICCGPMDCDYGGMWKGTEAFSMILSPVGARSNLTTCSGIVPGCYMQTVTHLLQVEIS